MTYDGPTPFTPPLMSPRFVLPLLIVLLAALAGGLWVVLGETRADEFGGLEVDRSVGVNPGGQQAEVLPGTDHDLPDLDRQGLGDVSTTVVLPLELEFELVSADTQLDAIDAPPLDTAATARLRGSMHGADGRGAVGHLEFIAGPNRGRVLETDPLGAFGANDLYPGISLVALRAPGTVGAEREVLLRREREAQLNVGFGRPAVVRGRVKDAKNLPLPTTKVVMDGQETLTDEEGFFYFPRMTSGKVPVYVTKPGYAGVREVHYITAGGAISSDKLTFVLRKGASLRVVVPERLGLGKAGELHLSRPLDGTGSRSFPWHMKSPVSIYAGESVQIEDLPAGRVRMQYFCAGAVVKPAVVRETLVAGSERVATFHLEPAPVLTGVVLKEGKPVAGAVVKLEAPDVTSTSIQAMGGGFGGAQFEMALLGTMPPGLQRAVTGANGKFRFTAGEELSPVRYLTAKARDGRAWAGRVVRPGERELELELVQPIGGGAGFLIETSERFQALPVKYVVDGKPMWTMLPPGERLSIEGLPAGQWKFSARWENEQIQKDVSIPLKGTEELFVPLPKGAIDGQSKEMREAMQ
jgi:hypothetical protein